MTPQLLIPNPKYTRLLYCKSRVKIRFQVYSGWCTDVVFRVFKICDNGDDTPGPSPESKKYAAFILQAKVKIRFPLNSGWCMDGAFRVVREHHSLPNPKNTGLLYCKS
nr:unnamed protein product [Callosobruchus analis]